MVGVILALSLALGGEDVVLADDAAPLKLTPPGVLLAQQSEPSALSPGLLNAPPSEKPPLAVVILGRAGGVVVGAAAAALLHEAGHAALTWGYGYKFVWPTRGGPSPLLPYWRAEDENGRRPSPERQRTLATGGFLVATILEELMLNSQAFPKSDVFVGGFVFYSLLNNITYVITDLGSYSRGGRGVGDIRDMACPDCNDWRVPRELIYALLIIHSGFTAARLVEDPGFLSWSFWAEDY